MKTILLSLILLIECFTMFGKPVDETRAKTVGLYFLQNKTNSTLLKDAKNLQLVYKVTATIGDALEERTMFYVFNIDTVGFVIVSGDDTVIPILGYSDQGNFIINDMPINIKKWLEGYKNEIIYVVSHDIKATAEIDKQWSLQLMNRNSNSTLSTNSVLPLIHTYWDQANFANQQSPLYNDFCPYDSQYNVNAVTGCVATAMAQVMKFWNYPATSSDFHSYNHTKYGTLSAILGNTSYQWSIMPPQLNSSSTSAQKNAVATLMKNCGVSVNMNYGVAGIAGHPELDGSGAQVIIGNHPSNFVCAENALKTVFSYDSSLQGLKRSSYPNYSDWLNLLKNEFNNGRPIIYDGFGTGGHCFIADGYDSNDQIHFTWGWSGQSDGYFSINPINPLIPTNTNYNFSGSQEAIIGIKPPASQQTYNLSLYDYVSPSATTINYGQAFTVSTNLTNLGTNSFSGDYTIGAFDNNGNFIDHVETKSNYTLPSQTHYANNLVFSTTGLFTLLPGTYYLGLFYRPVGGNWKIVQNNGSYTNFPQITIVYTNSISLNSTMTVTPGTILTQGQGASVNLDIINNGSTTFIGQYNVSLYNLDGTFVQNIGVINENNGLSGGGYSYQSPYLTFSTAAITATPGTYLLALQHQPTNGNLILTGSTTTFINPIRVTVVEAPYQPDIYEVNNSFSQSYNLPLSFSGNTTNINTSGSNAHVGNDNDYYKIVLPSGYNYTITPRLQDSYNNNNGNTYTLDALFTYSTDGVNWSTTYDDVLPNNITINNGGTIYFYVSPYFTGNTGTYLLDVNLSRTALPSKVVISQVYGGGGNTGAPYTNDYIELFNSGTGAQNLNGWSVQYTLNTGPAAGNTWFVTPLPTNFTLQPGQYFLIKCAGTGTNNLPSEDATSTSNLGLSAGKVILVSNTTAETTANPSGSQIIDKVGYGNTATGYEGSNPTAVLSNTTAALRNLGGCTDTDNNASDFSVGTPSPRNSASQFNLCSSLSVNQNTPEMVTLYPNPTSSKVFFDNSNSNFKEVAIYNYLGQEVSKTSFTTSIQNQEIDMGNLATGVYVLKFSNSETTQSIKIVKE